MLRAAKCRLGPRTILLGCWGATEQKTGIRINWHSGAVRTEPVRPHPCPPRVSAMPAKTVLIILQACVVLSAHGSDRDWNRAPPSRIASIVSRRCLVDRASRSSFHDDIAFAQVLEQALQLGSSTRCSGYLFLKDFPAASLLQRPKLQVQVLVLGGDACVTDLHGCGAVCKSVCKRIDFCGILLQIDFPRKSRLCTTVAEVRSFATPPPSRRGVCLSDS